MSKLVRLFPLNPRRGWYLQTYLDPSLGNRKGGMKFVAKRGWYEVEDEVAEALEEVRQKQEDPRSGPAFMIAKNAKEAKAMDADLVEPEDEAASVGTADVPVRHGRPGKRKGKGKGTPKTRQRKPAKGADEAGDAAPATTPDA